MTYLVFCFLALAISSIVPLFTIAVIKVLAWWDADNDDD